MSNDKFVHDRIYRGEAFEKFDKPHIILCGVGTVGSNLFDNLIRQNITNLTLIDDDRIEPHNIGNQIWEISDFGQKKVARSVSKGYNTVEADIKGFEKRLTASNIKKAFKGADLVVDGFDNSASRQLVQNYCADNNIPCLHIGLAADYCEVVWNDVYKVPRDAEEDVCEYPLTRHISMVAVVMATEQIIAWITEQKTESYYFTLKDFVRGKY